MNDLTTTPTADLIAEWERQEQASSPWSSWVWSPSYQNDIASELDRRCVDAGIHITDHGYFRYEFYEFDYIGYGKHTNKMACLRGEISAKEQHDLEGWLLLKEGGKG